MTRNEKRLIATAAALAGGLLSLYVFAPRPVRRFSEVLAGEARQRSRCIEDALGQIEGRLAAIEDQVRDAAQEMGHRLAEVKQRAVESYGPEGLSPEPWKLTRSDVNRDLPRIPGG